MRPRSSAFVLLGIGLALTFWDPSLEVPLPVTIAGALASTVVLAIILWRSVDRDLFAPRVFFPLLLIGFYGLGSLPLTQWGYVPGGMYLLTLLAVASLLVGIAIVGDDGESVGFRRLDDATRSRAAGLMAIVAIAAALAFAFTFVETGIPLLGAIDSSRLASAEDGYRNTLALSIRAAILIAALLLITGGRRPDRASWAAAVVLVVGLLLLFSTGNRGHLVLVALALVALVHYLVRRLPMRFVLSAGLVLLTVFSIAGYVRASQCDPLWAEGVEDHYGVPSEVAPLAPIYLAVRSVPHYFARVTEVVPEEHPYFYGRALATPLVTALPGHQPGIGQIVKEDLLQLEFVGFGIAAGLYVPGYMDFGYFGIVALMIGAGAALQWLYRQAMKGKAAWIAIYAFGVANVTLSMYGTLINSFSVLLIPAIVFTVFWFAERRRRPEGVTRPRIATAVSGMTSAALAGLLVMTLVGGVETVTRAIDSGSGLRPPTSSPIPGEGIEDPVSDPALGC
jgi:hypothetical protein